MGVVVRDLLQQREQEDVLDDSLEPALDSGISRVVEVTYVFSNSKLERILSNSNSDSNCFLTVGKSFSENSTISVAQSQDI